MAGLDARNGSGFLGVMLAEVGKPAEMATTGEPVQLSTEAIKTIQLVSECLLLRERTVALSDQPFYGCCDTIITRRKALTISATNAVASLKSGKHPLLCKHLADVAEHVSIITETAAQAVYMIAERTPGCTKAISGVLDPYLLARARLAIELATDGFERASTTKAQAMSMAVVVATHLDILREQTQIAASHCERGDVAGPANPVAAAQFKAISKGLSGTAGMLVSSLKNFVSSNGAPQARAECQMFVKPLIACINALIEYAGGDPNFLGVPPVFKKEVAEYVKPLQGAAMAVVSSSTLFIAAIKSSLTNPADQGAAALLSRYFTAVDDALLQVTAAVKAVRDAKFVQEDV